MTPLHQAEGAEVWQADCLVESDVDRVMQGRKADALVFDAPYSAKCHEGHDVQVASLKESFATNVVGGRRTREQAYAARVAAGKSAGRRALDYEAWGQEQIAKFCGIWVPRCSGWVVTITDHALAPLWAETLEASKLYVFPPLPLVETGSRVRMAGDGPSGWTCWIVVARPRGEPYSSWGTLRGAYVVPGEREINSKGGTDRIVGGKPLLAMQCIVRDYSRRGDLVVDPCLGGGTTIRAAVTQGRRGIGLEVDEGRAQQSAKTIARACREHAAQPELFSTDEVGT
jgi:site-specific DNA-methyltransferase (adenine-specific)